MKKSSALGWEVLKRFIIFWFKKLLKNTLSKALISRSVLLQQRRYKQRNRTELTYITGASHESGALWKKCPLCALLVNTVRGEGRGRVV